jgi:WD40 repeat protein
VTLSGREVLALQGHTGPVNAVAVAPDGGGILTGSGDGTARLWHVHPAGPRALERVPKALVRVSVSPDGRRIVACAGDNTASLWEADTGRRLVTLAGHTGPLTGAAFVPPEGRSVVTGSEDGTARVWDAESGREVARLAGHAGSVTSLAVSPDGRRVVTGGQDRTARVWDLDGGREVCSLEGHTGGISAVAWSPDGRQVVTASSDWTARLWDAATGRAGPVLRGHTMGVTALAWSPDGRHVATASWDLTVRVWDVRTGQEALTLGAHPSWVHTLAWSPDGHRLLTVASDGAAKLLDAATGREVFALPAVASHVAFFPDGRRLVVSNYWDPLRIWEAASDEQIAAWAAEERAAEESVVAARRERADRARAAGMIQDWLVLAPIPLARGETGAAAVDREQLPDEARLRPRAGERVRVGDRELAWREYHGDDYFLDFNALLKQLTEFSAGYAVCYVESEAERTGLELRVGCDDQAKVYLNGREVYCYRGPGRVLRYDQGVAAGITLRRGTNVLVFKVVNEAVDWKGCLRFVGPDGDPVGDLRVRPSEAGGGAGP